MYWKYIFSPLKLFKIVDFEVTIEKVTSLVRVLQNTLRLCVQGGEADKLQLILGELVKEETGNMLFPCDLLHINAFLSSIYNRVNCR